MRFIDSNIFLRYLTQDNPRQQQFDRDFNRIDDVTRLEAMPAADS